MFAFTKYNDFLKNAMFHYYTDDENIKYFGKIPKSRDITFKYCLEHLNTKKEHKCIVELGTSRSFVDGKYEGCLSNDTKYWEPNNLEKWDWSAGLFTKIFSECVENNTLYTVDIDNASIERCKIMTKDFSDNIKYCVDTSENFLSNLKEKSVDLLYLDTGDMLPIEFVGDLHLREAKIIVEKNILKDDGLILIDDVKNIIPKRIGEISNYGKSKYSIPYFLENNYKIIMDEYQVILKKNI